MFCRSIPQRNGLPAPFQVMTMMLRTTDMYGQRVQVVMSNWSAPRKNNAPIIFRSLFGTYCLEISGSSYGRTRPPFRRKRTMHLSTAVVFVPTAMTEHKTAINTKTLRSYRFSEKQVLRLFYS